LKLGRWRFCFGEACKFRIISYVDGKAKSEVVKDEQSNNFKHVHIQWWVPMKKRARNDITLYQDCWMNKWKCNLVDPK
jgi:hypothetical protein